VRQPVRAAGARERVAQALTPYRRQLIVLAPVLVLALFASWRVFAVTRHGMAVYPDSASYLGTADNLRHGRGPTVPFTMVYDAFSPRAAAAFGNKVPSRGFPAGYPAAIAAVSIVSGGLHAAARVLGVVLIAVNVLLLGVLTARMTNYRSIVVAFMPPAICVLVPDIVPGQVAGPGWFVAHTAIVSEPLFTAAFTAGILAIGAAAVAPTGRDWRWVPVAGGLTAVAFLTRYSGAALVLSGAIALLVFGTRRVAARLARAAVFVTVATAPMLLAVAAVTAGGGESTRPLVYHPVAGNLQALVNFFGRLLFPQGWPAWLRTTGLLVVVCLVVVGAIWAPPRVARAWADDTRGRTLIYIVLLTLWAYVDVVMASRAFFDSKVPIDFRILAPVRGTFLAVVVAVAFRWLVPFTRPTRVIAGIGAWAFLLLVAGWSAQSKLLTRALPRESTSAVEAAVARLPRGTLIVSNAPDHVYVGSGRTSYALPIRHDYFTGDINADFERQVATWAELLRARGGAIDMADGFYELATIDDLQRYVPVRLVARDAHERLYEVASSS